MSPRHCVILPPIYVLYSEDTLNHSNGPPAESAGTANCRITEHNSAARTLALPARCGPPGQLQ
jgi:hypothetical protein